MKVNNGGGKTSMHIPTLLFCNRLGINPNTISYFSVSCLLSFKVVLVELNNHVCPLLQSWDCRDLFLSYARLVALSNNY